MAAADFLARSPLVAPASMHSFEAPGTRCLRRLSSERGDIGCEIQTVVAVCLASLLRGNRGEGGKAVRTIMLFSNLSWSDDGPAPAEKLRDLYISCMMDDGLHSVLETSPDHAGISQSMLTWRKEC